MAKREQIERPYMVDYYTEYGYFNTSYYETLEDAQKHAQEWWDEQEGKGRFCINKISNILYK